MSSFKNFVKSISQSQLAEANAEIRRLRAKLAEKESDNENSPEDELDSSDDTPTKKGKKVKAKDTGAPDQEDPEDGSDENRAPPPKPTKNKDDDEKDALHGGGDAVYASDGAYRRRMNASIAACVAANDRLRGVAPPKASVALVAGDDGNFTKYDDAVEATVAAICAADRRRRGVE